jgi:hypothetical protein
VQENNATKPRKGNFPDTINSAVFRFFYLVAYYFLWAMHASSKTSDYVQYRVFYNAVVGKLAAARPGQNYMEALECFCKIHDFGLIQSIPRCAAEFYSPLAT